jgi:hypothetical protein
MHNQEQNWQNLFGDIPAEGISWHGTWTRYSPDQEVLTSFQGVRNFVPNQDRTVITHTNNLTYADGRTEEKQWQLDKVSCNHPDGMTHPAFSSGAKALSFGEGATVSMRKTLEIGQYGGAELFFRHENCRTSVVIMYGEKGDLSGTIQIREYNGSFPEQAPAEKLETISGKWKGTKQSMSPDLSISGLEEVSGLELDPTQGTNDTFFLPDGIVVNCPKQLQVGEAFELVAGKLVADNLYKRLTVKYDDSGHFMLFVSEVFHQQN